MRNADNPNDITVILGWSNLEKARAFSQSVSLNNALRQAGVIGSPEIEFLRTAE
jgi:hypothetical protein